MADTKISALTAVTTPSGADEYPVNQAGTSKKITMAQVRRSTDAYNVKDYGAVGDGSADDTSEIQAAIDAAHAAGGGIVTIPRGSYKVTTRLTLYGNITIKGSGKYTSVIYPTGCDGIYFIPGSPSFDDTQEHVVLEDFALQGDYTSGKIGIQFAQIRWWSMNRLRISNFKSHGIWLEETYSSTIRECDIFNNDGSGIFFSGAVNNVSVYGGEISGNNASGITVDGTQNATHPNAYNIIIDSVTIEGNALSGIRIVDGVTKLSIVNCYFELNQSPSAGDGRTPPTQPVIGYCIEIGTGENTTISNVNVNGNFLVPGAGSGGDGYGVYLGLISGLTILGNSIGGTGLYKIGMLGWAHITQFICHGNDDGGTLPMPRSGSSTLNGTSGRVITTNIPASIDQTKFPYTVVVTPTATLAGRLYVVKAANQFTVYSTSADSGTFDWAIVADGYG